MSIRWRADGRMVCAAMFPEEPGDTYIDDRLHYQLSVTSRAIVADFEHEENGLWYWIHDSDHGPYLRGWNESQLYQAPRWVGDAHPCRA